MNTQHLGESCCILFGSIAGLAFFSSDPSWLVLFDSSQLHPGQIDCQCLGMQVTNKSGYVEVWSSLMISFFDFKIFQISPISHPAYFLLFCFLHFLARILDPGRVRWWWLSEVLPEVHGLLRFRWRQWLREVHVGTLPALCFHVLWAAGPGFTRQYGESLGFPTFWHPNDV